MTKGILSGFNVVEIAHPCTEYGGCILAGLGADVYLIEPPGGSSLRIRRPYMPDSEGSSRRSLPYLTRNMNKHSVLVDVTDEAGRRLLTDMIERSDLVLSADPSDFHEAVVEARPPNLITISDSLGLGTSSIVPFAAGGGLASSGWPEQPPCNAPGWFALDGASIYAAVMGMLGAIARRRGAGDVSYEIPLEEAAVASSTPWTRPLMSYDMVAAGQGITTARLGASGYPFYPASDGYVRAIPATIKQWEAFVALLGSPDELVNGPWAEPEFRAENADVLQMMCSDETRKYTMEELFHGGQKLGLTISPVHSLTEFHDNPHIQGRGLFVTMDDPEFGDMEMMRLPLLLGEDTLNVPPEPAPGLGSGQAKAETLARGAVTIPVPRSDISAENPLEDVRILELGVGAVVPEAAALLASFGAEVFKIESLVHPDFLRRLGINGLGDVDGCPTFNQLNLGVKSVAADMTTEEGATLIRNLAAKCDIVMENMRGGVVEKWGLDYEGARAVKEDILYLSSQGLGRGVYDNYQTFGPNLQTFSGLTSQWSHPDDPHPVGTTLNHPDHTAGKQALVPLLAALLRRYETGEGQHIEAAQVEGGAYLIQSLFLEAAVTGEEVAPRGNLSPDCAPHGCYPCEGDDRWVAIAVESDEQWLALKTVIEGESGGSLPQGLDEVAGRVERREEIDAWVASYTSARPGEVIESTLRGLGIPVSRVLTGDDIAADNVRHANGFYVELDHAQVGKRTYTGLPILIGKIRTRPQIGLPPLLGEHTQAVLSEVLGVGSGEFSELEAKKMVGH